GDPIFTNPPATTEMRGLIELATQAEADAGEDDQRALTPASAFGAVLGWLLAQDGAGSGLDADLLQALGRRQLALARAAGRLDVEQVTALRGLLGPG
ncbi:MAG: phage tail protein, partial [Roseateles sp.]